MLYNCTLHSQENLNELLERDVEVFPRLKPVDDPSDQQEIKRVIREAVSDIPKGADVIIGGLGQFQILISQLAQKMGWSLYFVDMDFSNGGPKPRGIIKTPRWDRQEIFAIENNEKEV